MILQEDITKKPLWDDESREGFLEYTEAQQNNGELINNGERTDSKYNRQKKQRVQRPPAEGKEQSSLENSAGEQWC